jgi:ornithine carbamoyltransferase
MTRFGMDVVLAHPPGYELLDETTEIARNNAVQSRGGFTISHSMAEAFEGADIVYPKSWAPAAVMRQRTELLRAGDRAGLEQLERDGLAENARHQDWECNEQMMARTRDGRALYMHCLPADITGVNCEHGEVSEVVFERYRLATYREASFKPFVIAAMILATRFESPAALLKQCVERGRQRRG